MDHNQKVDQKYNNGSKQKKMDHNPDNKIQKWIKLQKMDQYPEVE